MHNYEQFSRNADIAIRERLSDATELNLGIAAHPETGGNEHFACAAHTEFLRHAGFMVETSFCGIQTAFCATAGSGFPVVALLAEYDALPLIGHGCGHCLHGSMSSLAGAALLPLMAELGGTLRVVGTPAEETNGAKVAMAEMGVFDDAALAVMIHCNDVTSFVRYRSLAMDAPEFTFTGTTAHAAGAPWEGRNALNGRRSSFTRWTCFASTFAPKFACTGHHGRRDRAEHRSGQSGRPLLRPRPGTDATRRPHEAH
jgi:metal-dependent amidase/aminoacylase/carboxypeptidase family protein